MKFFSEVFLCHRFLCYRLSHKHVSYCLPCKSHYVFYAIAFLIIKKFLLKTGIANLLDGSGDKKNFELFFMSNMEVRLIHACDLYLNKYGKYR